MESAPTWGVCGGGNVPDFEPPRCGGRERPPYGAGETRRPPGKMQFPRPLQTHVGDDARIVPGCSRRRRVREGHAPPLHGIRARPAKWACRGRPGERRAGCPHPAAPRGKANVPILNRQGAAGVNARPTEPGQTRRPPGKMQPPAVHRRGGFHIRPVRGGAGFAGGACPSPTWHPGTTGQMGLPRPPGRT